MYISEAINLNLAEWSTYNMPLAQGENILNHHAFCNTYTNKSFTFIVIPYMGAIIFTSGHITFCYSPTTLLHEKVIGMPLCTMG